MKCKKILNFLIAFCFILSISNLVAFANETSKDRIHFAIAVKENGIWTVNIKATDINPSWGIDDNFMFVNFGFGEKSYLDDKNMLVMKFSNTDDYVVGSVASITFYNATKNEYKDFYINFSENGTPTFQSEEMRDLVLVDEELRKKAIVLDSSDVDFTSDNKQYQNKYGADSTSEWARDDVNQAIALEFIPLDLQNKYTVPINRADFCEIAYSILEKSDKLKQYDESKVFTDVDAPYINVLAHAGIVYGKENNKFMPEDSISREEAAVILARMVYYCGLDVEVQEVENDTFSDHDSISSWAIPSVYKVNSLNIMKGVGDNQFSPKQYYTKEQAISTFMRMYRMF